MKFSAADAVDLGAAFRAGSVNDSAAALVEISDGILDLTLRLTFYQYPSIFSSIFVHFRAKLLFPFYHCKFKSNQARTRRSCPDFKSHTALKNKAGDI